MECCEKQLQRKLQYFLCDFDYLTYPENIFIKYKEFLNQRCFKIINTDKFSNLNFKVLLSDIYFRNYLQSHSREIAPITGVMKS